MTDIEKYQNANISSGYEPEDNGFTGTTEIQNYNQASTTLNAEQSKAVGEIQAALTIAQAKPRNENHAVLRIQQACKRKSLAIKSEYAFRRGTSMVRGLSIRLAEVLAQKWGNITFGYREIGQGDGYSEIEAFCWDLESNTKATRQFRIRHRRDKRDGSEAITRERDKYEHVASQAMRRVRACILEIIPSDVIELAQEECEKTIKRDDPRSKEEKVQSMVGMFHEIGVTLDMIESYLGHNISAITNSQYIQLAKIYTSITDGMANREDFFRSRGQQQKSEPKLESASEKTKRGRPKKQTEQKSDLDSAIAKAAKESEQQESKPTHPALNEEKQTKKQREEDSNQGSFFGKEQ